jgi:hypothetical protein
VDTGFPSGIAKKQGDRAVHRFHEAMNCSSGFKSGALAIIVPV